MTIDMRRYERFNTRVGASAARPPLVPQPFADAESLAFDRRGQAARAGLESGTAVLLDLAARVAAPEPDPEALRGLTRVAETARAKLPEPSRGYLEAVGPVTASVVAPLEERRRQAGVAAVAGALTQQKAVLRRLALLGAPLSTLRAVAKGQIERLHAEGLMAGDRAALERAWDEELAGNWLLGRLERDADLPLAEQPEAGLLEPETLMHLEGVQRQRQAARRTESLGGVLRGAVSGAAAGRAPTAEQTAALEGDLPGLGQAAAQEAAAWQSKQDAILGLVERTPLLGKLKDFAGGGPLYRRLLVEQQRRAGVPEGELRIWDQEESDAAVADVLALPDEDAPESERSTALLSYARQHLARLPAELRPLALAELTRRGLAPEDAAALDAVAGDLAARRDIAAQRQAARWAKGARDAGRRAPGGARPPAGQPGEGGEAPGEQALEGVPADLPVGPAAAAASLQNERIALIQRLEQAGPDEAARIEAEIRRLFPDDPDMQRRLRRLAGEARLLLHNEGVGQGQTDGWAEQRDALLDAMAHYVSPSEGRQEGARALAGQAADRERDRAVYATWPVFEDANGHPNGGLRVDPESGDAVLWNQAENRPVTDGAGQVVRLDAATLERLADRALADLQTAWEVESKLRQAAAGEIELSPEEARALRDQLEVATPYLAYLRQQGEALLERIARGDRGAETENLLQHFTELLDDPRLFVKQQEVTAWYDRHDAADIEDIYRTKGETTRRLTGRYDDLNLLLTEISSLAAIADSGQPGDVGSRHYGPQDARYLMEQHLDELTELWADILADEQALLELDTHPHPDFEPEEAKRLESLTDSQDWWLDAVLFAASVGAGYAELRVLEKGIHVFGLARSFLKTYRDSIATSTRAFLVEAGIDVGDPVAVRAFLRENADALAALQQQALLDGLVAAGTSQGAKYIADALAKGTVLVRKALKKGIEMVPDLPSE